VVKQTYLIYFMDNGKATASGEQVSIAYDPYREKELSLKEREIELKELEIELKELEIKSQLEINRRNTWLGSPLLITFFTVLVGSIGTAFFQAYSNNQLERQKFEFSLILKALEGKDKSILMSSDGTDAAKTDAAKRLRFLVELGVIKSLDSDVIDKLSRKPNDLPSFESDSKVSNVNFSCQLFEGIPTTVMKSSDFRSTKLIQWRSSTDYPDNLSSKERCNQVSARLQKAVSKGNIFLTTGNKNGRGVICTTSKIGGSCENVLFTISRGKNPELILKQLLNIDPMADSSSIIQE
jgi:Circadian oscillating protein COP23